MLFHPFQLFTIAAMFSPGLWFAPPRPPDTPPPSRRATFGYKIAAGFSLSQIYWLIPTTDHCSPDFLCFLFRESQSESLPALPAPRPISPRSKPAPTSRAYVSSLLRRSCPAVVIPPRPAPTCRNTHVHPTFEWAPQSPVPSPILAQPSCLPSSLPTLPTPTSPSDESTYVHPHRSILPFSPPRPTDAAPIFSVLLLVACIICRNSLGNILAIVLVASVDLAKSMVPVNVTLRSWRFKNVEHAARVLSGSVALGVIVLCYVVSRLSANYAVVSAFVLGLTVETILAWTKEVVSDIWTSPSVIQKYTSIATTNLESSNKVISIVEVQAPIVQVVDGDKDEIVIAPLSPPTVLPISPPVTSATEDDTVSGPQEEDPVLESNLEPTLTVDDTLQDASESNSKSSTVELPVVEVPDDATPDPEQLLEPLLASFVVAIPVSDVESIHDPVTPASVPKEDSPPVASPVIVTTPIIDVEVLVDENALVPELEPEPLSVSPVVVTPAANDKVIPNYDYAVSAPVPEQERESGPSPTDIATPIIEQEPEHSLIDSDNVTPVMDIGIIPDNVLVALALDATSLEDAFESKQQEIHEPLPAVDSDVSEDPPIRPVSPTTGNSMTELALCHPPLPVPPLELLEASSSEYTSDSTYLPRIRRRVRRSVKRERKAERDAAEAAAVATAQTSTQHHHDLDTPDWCLVVRGKNRSCR